MVQKDKKKALEPPSSELQEKARAALARQTRPSAGGRATAKKDREREWLSYVAASGTSSDKAAALSLLVREDPIAGLPALRQLVALCAKGKGGGRNSALLALNTARELFVQLLPPHRELHGSLREWRGLEQAAASEEVLARVAFEVELHACYRQLIRALEGLAGDTVEHSRRVATRTARDLLLAAPRHQAALLVALLANKLGDTARPVAAQVSFYLVQVTQKCAALRQLVVRELEAFLLRQRQSPRALYYAAIALNQTPLRAGEHHLADQLVNFYFAIFRRELEHARKEDRVATRREEGKQEEEEEEEEGEEGSAGAAAGHENEEAALRSRLTGALLTGLNRAFPFASRRAPSKQNPPPAPSGTGAGRQPGWEEQMEPLFRLAHITPFARGLQALLLIYQVETRGLGRAAPSDRFYRALYARLAPLRAVAECSRQALLLNLLFKAMQRDPHPERIKAFLKRLFQLALHLSPGFACGCLVLLAALLRARPGILAFLQQPEEQPDEPDEGTGLRGGWAGYEPGKREPRFAGAEHTSLWELLALLQHWHPSVQALARSLLEGRSIEYASDPLADFTLAAFLDKFVNKKPKSAQAARRRAASLMQARVHPPAPAPSAVAPAVAAPPPDQLFFARFFERKARLDQARAKPTRRPPDDDTADADLELDAEDEELEHEADAAIRRKLAELGADPDADEDGDEEDLDLELALDDDLGAASDSEDEAFAHAVNDEEVDDAEEEEEEEEHEEGEEDEESLEDAGDTELDEDMDDLGDEALSDEDAAEDRRGEQKRPAYRGSFADAAEFAHLLEASTAPPNPKQTKWEERTLSHSRRRKNSKKRFRSNKSPAPRTRQVNQKRRKTK